VCVDCIGPAVNVNTSMRTLVERTISNRRRYWIVEEHGVILLVTTNKRIAEHVANTVDEKDA
jgi:hypothetical protein